LGQGGDRPERDAERAGPQRAAPTRIVFDSAKFDDPSPRSSDLPIALEAEGVALSWDCARRNGRLSLGVHIRAVVELLRSLEEASSQSDVYGDVCPANLLFTREGTALMAAGSSRVPQTDAYVAPEVAAGRPATQQSDIFAAGIVLLEGIAHRRLTVEDVRTIDPVTVRHDPMWARHRYDPLLSVALRAIAPDPALRWPTVREFADAISKASMGRETSRSSLGKLVARTIAEQDDRATPLAPAPGQLPNPGEFVALAQTGAAAAATASEEAAGLTEASAPFEEHGRLVAEAAPTLDLNGASAVSGEHFEPELLPVLQLPLRLRQMSVAALLVAVGVGVWLMSWSEDRSAPVTTVEDPGAAPAVPEGVGRDVPLDESPAPPRREIGGVTRAPAEKRAPAAGDAVVEEQVVDDAERRAKQSDTAEQKREHNSAPSSNDSEQPDQKPPDQKQARQVPVEGAPTGQATSVSPAAEEQPTEPGPRQRPAQYDPEGI
jgi:hypothetical protein